MSTEPTPAPRVLTENELRLILQRATFNSGVRREDLDALVYSVRHLRAQLALATAAAWPDAPGSGTTQGAAGSDDRHDVGAVLGQGRGHALVTTALVVRVLGQGVGLGVPEQRHQILKGSRGQGVPAAAHYAPRSGSNGTSGPSMGMGNSTSG